ncbi:transcriptional regulator, TetR family [Hydrocarboniphaga daqingensis]|jgi:AcrR family transcriptional regulator|uniref:Transcriptional regulator, TetR family n=1 Tax=Hydrocarboniphaga daqingensis TaxID=490188 RepID=A0A1M5LEK0_9GAMM|nr:TetR/AcrR family transcriptional regulator [Hydrocarboniphaga daqingensis]SHG63542.1 transcriptional regulator, TetR family [Hydrocarboniphaga daqingensis]
MTDAQSIARSAQRITLTAANWAEAALDAIAENGIEAVAVEPLARRLGVTKGSFYWHFTHREALLHAALELWERYETADTIARAESSSDPRERMHSLFRQLANTDQRSERILLALSGSDNTAARSCVQRVTECWRSYVEVGYRAMGMDATEARHWATLAYSTYIGTVRMRRDNPDALPTGSDFNDYLRFLIKTLIPGGVGSVAGNRDAADLLGAARATGARLSA